MSTELVTAPVIHVRYDGRSVDLTMAHLDIGSLSTDEQVKTAVAGYFQVPASKLRDYDVVKEPNGNMTLRPVANFG
jgi:hypothetical protein